MIVALGLLGGAATPVAAQARALRVSYSVRALDSTEVRVGAGQAVTLVAVFATWCTTCRSEFATLDSLRRSLATRGVRVVALGVDEGDDTRVRRFAAARAGGVLVAHDASGAVGRAFGTVGVPESYLVDAMGVVRWHAQGELRGAIPSLRRALAVLR
ncbi:MAG: TlpA family protein disulfide reductase [Gemmatimonadaceae bacterium]|nr:TlpA family protein disulfide reductase [Gemmatimonadaceae bacterium]